MASLRSLIVKIGADVTNVEKALASVGESAKTLDAGLKKLGTTPIGRQAIAGAEELTKSVRGLTEQQQKLANQSLLAARGLEAIGGPARLMKTELDQVAKTVQRGLDAFRALGQQAPVELQKVNAAIEKQQALLKGGGLAQAFGSGLPGGAVLAGGITGAAAAAGTAFGLAAKQALDYADALIKVSDRTGDDVVALQRLDAIARVSGNSLEDIGSAINRFQRNLASNDREAGAALERIGLSFAQLRALSPDEQFIAIAKGLQSITDPAQQASIAIDLFGRGGVEVLPSLKAKVEELAGATVVMSKESVEALDKFGDALQTLKRTAIVVAGDTVAAILSIGKSIKDNLPKGPLLTPEQQKELKEAAEIAAGKLNLPPIPPPLAPALPGLGAPGLAGAGASEVLIAQIERQSKALREQAEFTLKVIDAQRDLFSGETIDRAKVLVAALGEVGNISRLTAAEQKALLGPLQAALDAYTALGQQAPDGLRAIVQELVRLQLQQRTTVSTVGQLAEAAQTAFSQEEFRNIAAGFEANGDVIIQTLDALAEHARETEEAFRKMFGVTSGLSLGLPAGVTSGNRDLINEARAELNIKPAEDSLRALSQAIGEFGRVAQGAIGDLTTGLAGVVNGVANMQRAVQIFGASSFTAIGAAVQLGVVIGQLIARFKEQIVAAFAAIGRGLRSVFHFLTFGLFSSSLSGGALTEAARRAAGLAATGGVVTTSGIQRFQGGGRVLPFLAGRGTDIVPALLTPGEVVLNKKQQASLASTLGGLQLHFDQRGAFFGAQAGEEVARIAMDAIVRRVSQNKGGAYTRLRGALGMTS